MRGRNRNIDKNMKNRIQVSRGSNRNTGEETKEHEYT